MTFYINLYIIFYMFTLTLISILINNFLSINLLHKSIPYLTTYISKFSKLSSIFFAIMLSLTGLPPFLLFFVKFNFLITLFYKNTIFSNLLIFLILFLNMLFYSQIFLNKNININLNYKNDKKKQNNFKYVYIIVLCIMFVMFSIFFFQDFFYILSLTYNWQH